jgi:uncharacterized protein YdaU (DUF1376 family)
MSTSMMETALDYAARGWFVFPLYSPLGNGCSCPKGKECKNPGKHPRTLHGLNDASTYAGQVSAWWSKWPNANIGIATGKRSGLLVVDLDHHGDKNGESTLSALAEEYGSVPNTLTAKTGTGVHLYFQYPVQRTNCSAGKVGEGIDVRSDGGYVVAPPSRHASGREYAWVNAEQPLAELPTWLRDRLVSPARQQKVSLPKPPGGPRSAPAFLEGSRNKSLFNQACTLRGQNAMDEATLTVVMRKLNEQVCIPPLEESEVDEIVRSACKYSAERGNSKRPKRGNENPLPWFQLDVRTWLGDQNIAVMSDAQTGWYIRLMVYAWQSGGFLPADKNKLGKLAHARSLATFKKQCDLVLEDYDELEVNGEQLLINQGMFDLWTEKYAIWMEKKRAGEASAAQRAMERQQRRDAAEQIEASAPHMN